MSLPAFKAPALPMAAVTVLARPNLPAPVMLAVSPPPAPVLRPATVASVTRNLQAAVGPQPLPAAPTRQGFPGFVSRNFNQVTQHQPASSSAGLLNNLSSLIASPAPSAPERRTAPRHPAARPVPVKPASLPASENSKPAVVSVPSSNTRKTPPKPASTRPALARLPIDKPATAPAQPAPKAPLPPAAAPPAATGPSLPRAEQTKSASGPNPSERARLIPPVQLRTPEKNQAKDLKPSQESPKVETKPSSEGPLPTPTAVRRPEPTPEAGNHRGDQRLPEAGQLLDPKSTRTSLSDPVQVSSGLTLKAEKLTPTRPADSELKIGEIQRQLPITPAMPREQLEMAQRAGAGLAGGSGGGGGGGGGQQRQQQPPKPRPQVEAIEETEACQTQTGAAEANLRMLSCELREAIFGLRDPARRLGAEPQQRYRGRLRGLPQEEQQPPERGDCPVCGRSRTRGEVCRGCSSQRSLRLLQTSPGFISYRVFLTLCPRPVSSRALLSLRNFSYYPKREYDVSGA